jgi:serine/threonine protein kinase
MFSIFKKNYNFNFIIPETDSKKIKNKKHLENAEKIKSLGHGGSSQIYLYKCKNNAFLCNKLFVVKQINYNMKSFNFSKYSFDKKCKIAIKKEFIINKILQHPNIIDVIGIDILNKSLLYKYDYSNDLLDYFVKDDTNFSPKKYFKYFIQVIDAVNYMHSIGIAHMDIKLENILLNPLEKKIKLIDFGHSCFFKKGNTTIFNNGIKGTEYYIPPEVWKGSYMSDKVDVWCCGVLLYNFIYNKVPWNKAVEQDDDTYALFKKYRLKNILLLNLFKYPSLYGFNHDDSNIINELFLMMFEINYYERCKINEVYKKLLNITLE